MFAKLVGMRPVDKMAALVTSQSPVVMPEGPTITCAHWEIPPETKPVAPDQEDLTGRRFGQFTVIGYLGKQMHEEHVPSKWKNGKWLVRCSCGAFENRYRRSILNPKNDQDMCVVCRKTEYMRNNR